MRKRIPWHLPLAVALILVGFTDSGEEASAAPSALPNWLEPRGLSVVELVGRIPESYLQGTILSYGPSNGIVVYESGTRNGNTVVVNTTIYPRLSTPSWAPNQLLTYFGCLGQEPHYDHMASAVPRSTLRIYNGAVEVTSQIQFMFLTQMVTQKPVASSSQWNRYPRYSYGNSPGYYPLPMTSQGLNIPPNSGCEIWIPGQNYTSLRGVFTLTLDSPVNASVVGSQAATFQSYIGPGDVGIFQPLMQQLKARYGNRDTRVPLSIPAGADYFLLKFPPMPGDAYTDLIWGPPNLNASRPSGGTYRLADDPKLSADMVFAAAFPLQNAWQDADQAKGSEFLPLLTNLPELATPEYVLPAGIAWNSCFTQGSCSREVLGQIHDAVMSLEIVYLSVSKPASGGEWVSLQMAGPAWSPTNLGGSAEGLDFVAAPDTSARAAIAFSETSTSTHRIFLPFVSGGSREELPTGCPCGWFDPLGRMLGFWPGPAATRQQ